MSNVVVLDVSKYNNISDYSKAARSVGGVIIRCGYRGMKNGQLTEDPAFATHVKNFKEQGIPIGVYFFTTAINEEEGAQEAAFTYSLLRKYNINPSFPVFVDSEMSNNKKDGRSDSLNKSQRTAAVNAFCQKIQILGYTAGIYASDSWFNSMLDYNICKQYKLWVAKYSTNKPKYVKDYCGWQFTSNGSVSGIKTRVDLSYWYNTIGEANNKADNSNVNPYVVPTETLKVGSHGQGVYWLQFELKKLGYDIYIDGQYGSRTKDMVIKYQKSRGLEADGIVGSITRTSIINRRPPQANPEVGVVLDTEAKISLTNVPLYSNSLSNDPKREISGEYYIWNSAIKNGKIRICKLPAEAGNIFKVIGWVSVNDIDR